MIRDLIREELRRGLGRRSRRSEREGSVPSYSLQEGSRSSRCSTSRPHRVTVGPPVGIHTAVTLCLAPPTFVTLLAPLPSPYTSRSGPVSCAPPHQLLPLFPSMTPPPHRMSSWAFHMLLVLRRSRRHDYRLPSPVTSPSHRLPHRSHPYLHRPLVPLHVSVAGHAFC